MQPKSVEVMLKKNWVNLKRLQRWDSVSINKTECIGLTYVRYVHTDIKQQQQLNWSQLDDAKKWTHYFENQ